ncbi:PEP-CTERM sorting domain-containing protein [Massilia oculi]|uniref:PEP-CTERM sorting domain-containing protein n=1 Tax=Massilia oculi TaxID=945844 RepID=UPI0028ACF89C|nr:PEP-CTERM sorting domain-containing protein [Massilia oculi]
MKVLKKLAGAAALMLATTGAVHAIEYTSLYNPEPDRLVTFLTPVSYSHDLTSSGLPDNATLNWATLDVRLYDILLGSETVRFFFNGNLSETVQNVSLFGQTYDFDVKTALQDTGILDVTLRVSGLFQTVNFAWSELTADVTPITPSEVPEPATLLTLGAGLLGLAATRRRRMHKD